MFLSHSWTPLSMSSTVSMLIGLLSWLWVTPTFAQNPAPDSAHAPETTVSEQSTPDLDLWVAVKGGVAAFPLTSQSPALTHLIKPLVRLEGGYRITPRLGFGIEFSAVVDNNSNYRLVSGAIVGRAAAYLGDVFSIWFGFGAGAGNAPPILASDLIVTEDVALTVEMALQFRWVVVDNLMSLGIDVANQNIVMTSLAATIQFDF